MNVSSLAAAPSSVMWGCDDGCEKHTRAWGVFTEQPQESWNHTVIWFGRDQEVPTIRDTFQ